MAVIYRRGDSPVWYARFTVAGRLQRVSTGVRNRREAQHTADRLEAEAGRDVFRSDDIRLVAAAAGFFDRGTLRPKTEQCYRSSLANLVEVLGNFPMTVLEHRHLTHYLEVRRSKRVKDATILRDLAFLSSVFEYAMTLPNGPKVNIVRTFRKKGIRDSEPRHVWLTRSGFEELLGLAEEDEHRHILILLAFTGMRLGEVLALSWSEVDFATGHIHLIGERTKNGAGRSIPMARRVCDVLRTRRDTVTSQFVFPSRNGGHRINPNKWWRPLRVRFGRPDLRIHDLRHTFASWQLQAGTSDIVVQHLLGHKTASMTKRYAHPNRMLLENAMRAIDNDTGGDTKHPTQLEMV